MGTPEVAFFADEADKIREEVRAPEEHDNLEKYREELGQDVSQVPFVQQEPVLGLNLREYDCENASESLFQPGFVRGQALHLARIFQFYPFKVRLRCVKVA